MNSDSLEVNQVDNTKSWGMQPIIHYENQEKVARVFMPLMRFIYRLSKLLYGVFRIEGILYGVRRAYWRSRLKSLGIYSDIGTNVHIKCPELLSVGTRSSIGHGSFIDASGEVQIGNGAMISHYVSINSITHQTIPPYHEIICKKTIISDGVWIGACSVILEGVTIGENAIVAAGAVVRTDVAANNIVGGVPARILGKVNL